MFSRRLFLRYSASLASTVWLSTSLSGCSLTRDRSALSDLRFTHGVASGDPVPDGIVLWTRAQPERGATATLGWELARDPQFQDVVRSGEARTDAGRDFTVKIDVRELQPGTDYYYRFIGAGSSSPTGRARTLVTGSPDRVRLAVFSCSNYPAGYFHAYAEAARLGEVDAFLHLGDYFYEYGAGGYATERAAELGRELPGDNSGELLTLTDYRRRYALYRSDPDLQAVHAAGPMIAVWDDHEIANDTWRDGAQNHNDGEGEFAARRAAAVQAYFEWLPIRAPLETDRIYRSFDFGDLVSLHMLDTRVIGRDEQIEYAHFMDREAGTLDSRGLASALAEPSRTLLGAAQREWLAEELGTSPGRWQVLGQQVLMARMLMPAELLQGLFARRDFEAASTLIEDLAMLKSRAADGEALDPSQQARLATALPYNLDAWDGYPAEREAIYAMAKSSPRPLVVLAGDTHNAWFSQLQNGRGEAVGVEFGTPGVSSPGMESYLRMNAEQASQLASTLPLLIDELEYCDLQHRGFMEVVFERDAVKTTWHFLSSVQEQEYRVTTHQVTVQA